MNSLDQSYIELNFKNFIKDLVLKVLESDFNSKLYNKLEVVRSAEKHLLEHMLATFYGLSVLKNKDEEKYNYLKNITKDQYKNDISLINEKFDLTDYDFLFDSESVDSDSSDDQKESFYDQFNGSEFGKYMTQNYNHELITVKDAEMMLVLYGCRFPVILCMPNMRNMSRFLITYFKDNFKDDPSPAHFIFSNNNANKHLEINYLMLKHIFKIINMVNKEIIKKEELKEVNFSFKI